MPKYLSNNVIYVLMFWTLVSMCFVLLRAHLTGTTDFFFLIWNLVLAAVPFFIAIIANNAKGTALAVYTFIWFVFYPNAPYILTDFIHVDNYHFGLYDFLLVLSFSLLGLILGFYSLLVIHTRLMRTVGEYVGWLLVFGLSVLIAYGVYIGRIHRFNSWDILINLKEIINTTVLAFSAKPLHNELRFITYIFTAVHITLYSIFYKLIHAKYKLK